jgi:uncharacterized protein (TIGR02246 family)
MLRIAGLWFLFIPLGFMLMPLATPGQSANDSDEKAIRDVLDRFKDAWNRHDVHAFAALFAEDADFTNWRGDSASGRAKIEEFHTLPFNTIFKSSVQTFTDVKIRFIRPDVASVDVRWTLTGATDAQGNPRPDRKGLLTFVMTKSASGKWEIAVMHNLDLSALPPPTPPPPAPASK